MTATIPTARRDNARKLTPGNALHCVAKKQYAIYLRCLPDGRYTVLSGWRTMEGFSRDYLSEGSVAGMEGTCHDSLEYDFGSDLEAALLYYSDCIERLAIGSRPAKLDRHLVADGSSV